MNTEAITNDLYEIIDVHLHMGVVNWYLGRPGFHRLLKQVIDLVGPDKILFGSDQMNVP
jgi:predicted TIM-barrel fold metal-dependent hydrolase